MGGADVGIDSPGCNPAAAFKNGDDFGLGAEAMTLQQGKIVFPCLDQRHVGQIFKSHSVTLPL